MGRNADGTRAGRFFARRGRKLAWSMTSPSTIVVAGGALAAGILLGLPALAIGLVGAGAYAVKVAASTFTGKDVAALLNPEIDMSGLRSPYLDWVERGISSRDTFEQALRRLPAGPLHDRLAGTADEMDEVLAGLTRVARRAQGIDDYLRQPTVVHIQDTLSTARARLAETRDSEVWPERKRTVESLEEQARVATRLDTVSDKAMSRLESTITSLDQLVAQLMEIQLAAEDAEATDTAPPVDDLIDGLHAVRDAVAELDPHASELSPEEREVEAALVAGPPRTEAQGLQT
ncbi:MAG: hypothetical protein IT198_05185 [Acidimicrobiia bacterium]|nr:hypothetical protein [Acidimicrobiia bacterium]